MCVHRGRALQSLLPVSGRCDAAGACKTREVGERGVASTSSRPATCAHSDRPTAPVPTGDHQSGPGPPLLNPPPAPPTRPPDFGRHGQARRRRRAARARCVPQDRRRLCRPHRVGRGGDPGGAGRDGAAVRRRARCGDGMVAGWALGQARGRGWRARVVAGSVRSQRPPIAPAIFLARQRSPAPTDAAPGQPRPCRRPTAHLPAPTCSPGPPPGC